MNAPEDKTLDKTIEKALGGAAKEFDFEAFKEQYPEQVQQYRSQVRLRESRSARPGLNLRFFAKLAVAALLLTAVGLSLLDTNKTPDAPDTAMSAPASSMMSLMALNRAYRQGGLDAIDDQYAQAYAKLGPRPSSVTLSALSSENL
jgi:hypothetical protein